MPLFEELTDFKFWKAVRTEFLATALLTVLGCGSIATSRGGGVILRTVAAASTLPTPATSSRDTNSTAAAAATVAVAAAAGAVVTPSEDPRPAAAAAEPPHLSTVKVSLAFGVTVAVLTQCCGHVSGAHLNPALSAAMLVNRNVTVCRCAAYCVAQCAGATCGAAILYGLLHGATGTPWRHLGHTVVTPGAGITAVQGFGIEFIATFLYVFSYVANVDGKREDMGSRALYIGLAVMAGHLFAFELTGASMNPARSLGPAIVTNTWTNHWIYWVAPLLAGFLAALTYEYTEESSRSFETIRERFKDRPAPHHLDHLDLPSLVLTGGGGGATQRTGSGADLATELTTCTGTGGATPAATTAAPDDNGRI